MTSFEFNQKDEGATAAPAGGCAAGRGAAADPGREGPAWEALPAPAPLPGAPPGLRPTSAAPGQKQVKLRASGSAGEALWGRRVALPTGLGSGHRPAGGASFRRGGCCSRQGQGVRPPRGGGQSPYVCPLQAPCPSALKPPAPLKVPGEAAFQAQRPPSS